MIHYSKEKCLISVTRGPKQRR